MLTNIHENSWEHFLFSLCLRKWWFNSSVRWRFSFLSLRDTEKEMVRHNTACLFWQKNTAANSNKNCYHCFFCLIFFAVFFFFLNNDTCYLFLFLLSNRFLYPFYFCLLLADKGCGQNRIHIAHSSSPFLDKDAHAVCLMYYFLHRKQLASRNKIWYKRLSFAWGMSSTTLWKWDQLGKMKATLYAIFLKRCVISK